MLKEGQKHSYYMLGLLKNDKRMRPDFQTSIPVTNHTLEYIPQYTISRQSVPSMQYRSVHGGIRMYQYFLCGKTSSGGRAFPACATQIV
jgi:hypothetical protein